MSLIINLFRFKWVLLLFLHLLLTSVSYADFEINHCTPCGNDCYDCGNVLVGAALLEPEGIKWKGNGSRAVIILEAGGSFGFSGVSNYLIEPIQQDRWTYTSTTEVSVEAGAFSTPSPMGHYFAPKPKIADNKDDNSSPNRYITQFLDNFGNVVNTNNEIVNMQGTGIADDNAAITLKVDLTKQSGDLLCTTDNNTQCKCQDGSAQCQEIVEQQWNNFIFTVTPQVDSTKLPAGVSDVKHVWIDMIFNEKDTNCDKWDTATNKKNGQSFEILNNTLNSFNINDYYHYLHPNGPTLTSPDCRFAASFLVSKNKPFQISAKNRRSTEGGYTSITFAVRGHYHPTDSKLWPGSQPTFRLKTPTSGTLNVTVNGNGKISSNPAGINECGTQNGTCTADFQAGTPVQLTAEPGIGVNWSGNCDQNGKVNNIGVGGNITCIATFPLKSNALTLSGEASNTQFYETISVNGQGQVLNPNNPVSVGFNTPIEINTSVKVELNDQTQKAEVLVVMAIGGEWYMKIPTSKEEFKFIPWDINPLTLIAAGYQESLGEILEIKAFGGQIINAFNERLNIGAGQHKVFVWTAYRINTNKVVFNETPISFNINIP